MAVYLPAKFAECAGPIASKLGSHRLSVGRNSKPHHKSPVGVSLLAIAIYQTHLAKGLPYPLESAELAFS